MAVIAKVSVNNGAPKIIRPKKVAFNKTESAIANQIVASRILSAKAKIKAMGWLMKSAGISIFKKN